MRLYEFEGKGLLLKYGIATPRSQLYSSDEPIPYEPVVVKAQTLSGGRGKEGLIAVTSRESAQQAAEELLKRTHHFEYIDRVLLEEKIEVKHEFYVAITYDTDTRSAVVAICLHGGVDINAHADAVKRFPVYPTDNEIAEIVRKAGFRDHHAEWESFLRSAINCFFSEDCTLLEINPVARTHDGKLIALDAMIELEDEASFRHQARKYPARQAGFGRAPTEREERVKEINAQDFRGTIKYLELDGDIGFLAAGGGGSITCMDALTSVHGRPSNFTEFSGNPSDEKVYELTKVILSKPKLCGLWIVGAIANFTVMDTTMSGVIRALGETKPAYPIVVRRSGPHEKEGIALLQKAKEELGLDMIIYGAEMPMTKSAIIIKQKADDYRRQHGHTN